MKVKVDKQKCIGCGLCMTLCPQVFELREGKSYIKEDADLENNLDCIREAIQSCPVRAIGKYSTPDVE